MSERTPARANLVEGAAPTADVLTYVGDYVGFDYCTRVTKQHGR